MFSKKLISIINEKIDKIWLKNISHHIKAKLNEELFKEIKKVTTFLGETEKVTENLYCIVNNIKTTPTCPICNKGRLYFKGWGKGYRDYCSISCSRKSSNVMDKVKKTNRKRYGSDFYTANPKNMAKISQANIDRTWYKTNLQSPKFIKEMEEKCLKEHWVKHWTQSKKYKENREKDSLEKYGVVHFFQSDYFKENFLQNLLKNLKTEEHKEKIKKWCLEKLWTTSPFASKEIQEKIKKNNIEKYWVPYPMQNRDVKNRAMYNVLESTGYISNLQNPKIQEKIKKTNIKKYWKENFASSDLWKEIIKEALRNKFNNWEYQATQHAIDKYNKLWMEKNVNIDFKEWNYIIHCNKCWNSNIETPEFIYSRMIALEETPCINCIPRNYNQTSKAERVFVDFINIIYKTQINTSNRTIIAPQEIDMVLEDIKVWIEINWIYWHSDQYKDKKYHYNKTQQAKEKGYQLIHLFEDEIKQGMELIYSIIANKGWLKDDLDIEKINKEFWLELNKVERVYARKTKLVTIIDNKRGEKKIYKKILEAHHIQSWDNAKYYYALEDKKTWKILSIMTFKTMSVDKNQISSNVGNKIFELSRYVTIPWVQVIGWFQRMLKAFRKDIKNEFPWIDITLLTYSNLRYSDEDNNVYLRNWFEKVWFTWISYYYTYKGQKYHRFKFRKDQLYNKYLPENWILVDKDYKKESEAWMIEKMQNAWIQVNKVYDAWHIKWIIKL